MPIDPNIIAGLRTAPPVALPDPMEQYGKSLALKNLMMQGDQAQRADQDDQAVRDAYRKAGGDSKTLRALLQSGGQYKQVQALDKFDLENAEKKATIGKHEADTAKSQFEVQIGQIQHGSAILSTAKDQPSWDQARRVMELTFPNIAAQLPQQYDPAFIQAKIAAGQTMTQKLAAEQAAKTMAETGRHNVETEKNSAATVAETARANRFKEENPGLQHIETPDGISAFNPRTGTAAPVLGADGKPIQGGKALTESQGKATGMALRAQTAHDILTNLEDAGTKTPGIIKQGAGAVPLVGGALAMGVNKLPTWAGGPNSEQNRVEQAQRDFVNAALRVESGASISDSEFANARKQYFPQPGDDTATIEQKRKNRETEIQSLKLQAGSGAKNVVAQPKKPLGGSDMAKTPAEVAKLSDADLLSALGLKR